jgi:hypothetical protein
MGSAERAAACRCRPIRREDRVDTLQRQLVAGIDGAQQGMVPDRITTQPRARARTRAMLAGWASRGRPYRSLWG